MVTTPVSNLTFEEYLKYDDGTGFHYELVDGRLELINIPTIEHLLIAKFLEQTLDAEILRLSSSWLTFRETGTRTGKNKSRLTDLCVVTQEQARDLLKASAVFETPPLMIVEVVSPDSIKRDYRYKRSEYAAVGVPEYWVVDPLELKITVLFLEEGFYEEEVFTADQKILSRTFPELAIAPHQIFAAGNL
ncbi:Uma2 family endonuclease [Nostoc sp. FACHB-152]|uniref:Uma2 family endonuclease n=1 Tax=unclassified Nostoc TaxID=2593658 RepID=UPI00168428AD|nr:MULTISPECIES: Uma2 family endonuclease [unclassified Nostoc]MBD2450858.1 Uma2 family endonuclease [Nostoc sp. FACHB-152]MBD2472342.1 Uma2 family endonuclease [Nostoc sp. FACHB-145]